MRTHEEFVNEIYTRKEEYLKQKRVKRKRIITALVPLAIIVVAYSVLILPAMMPAKQADPRYEEPAPQTDTQSGASSHTATVPATDWFTQSSSNGASEPETANRAPQISVSLDKAEYKADEEITLTITDTANVGFGYSERAELWERSGSEWQFIPNYTPKPSIAYELRPIDGADSATVKFSINLNEYENLKPDTQYKLVLHIEGEGYEAYFTLTE